MPRLRHLLRRLTLSETARDRVAHIVAGLLIAVIVVCVVIVVVALAKRGVSTPRPPYPTNHFTPTPSRPGIYHKNCAEAHKDGRWNIPADDPAYRPAPDKDHDGVACESRDR